VDPTLVWRAGSVVTKALPASVAVGAASLLSGPAAALDRRRREQVERNLRRVYGPQLGGATLRRRVRRTFASYARYWAESLRLPGTSPERLERAMAIEGWEHLTNGIAGGRGVIVALPHLGGWEWAGFWLATVQRLPVSVVVEALEPRPVFEWFADLRRSFGMNVIPLGPSAGGDVLRALRANHIVCLLSDRDLDGRGVPVEFFGERTTLPAGPATLALRTGAPLLPSAVYYRPPGHVGSIQPPLPVERTGRFRDDVTVLTQALAHELETLIRVEPEQWHLMSPNWPSDPGYGR
jgi:phosphatidylinositol dimannoside acyltransferase